MSIQQALWLPGLGQDFAVGQRSTHMVLANLSSRSERLFFFVQSFPAVIGEEAAGTGSTSVRASLISRMETGYYSRGSVHTYYPLEIPKNVSFDQAASVQVGIILFAVGLYAQQLEGLASLAPWEDGGKGKYAEQPIVIMGGASRLGQYGMCGTISTKLVAIQLARLSVFYPIITTASLHDTELISSLGATHVLDRKLPSIALIDVIAKITSTTITVAFGAISLPDTQQPHDILTARGTLLVVTEPVVANESDDKVIHTDRSGLLPSSSQPGDEQEIHACVNAVATTMHGDLNGVSSGLQRLENDLVSGRKLVIHPWETE